ncbi:MAG: hypothetical protein II750_05540 [Bacteroidaceae bacterium]|nr:hypothetical protein [Bacteroidaceae bacterium]
MKQIKIYKLRSVNESDPPGSINNPYTWAKFMEKLYVTFDWIGGYVEGRGYIPQNVSVAGSSIMIIDGSSGDSSYYPYWFFNSIDTTLHHTYTNPYGSQVVLTDISVKASIDVYRLTIKVDITKKTSYDVFNIEINPSLKYCSILNPQNLTNQLTGLDSKCSFEIIIDLHSNSISLPSVSLGIMCYYTYDG